MRRCPGRGAGASARDSGGYDFCLGGAIRFITSGLLTISTFRFWVRFSNRPAMRRCPGGGAGASALDSGGYDFCVSVAISHITNGLFTISAFYFWVRFFNRLDMRRCSGRGLCSRRSGSSYQNFESFFDDAALGNLSPPLAFITPASSARRAFFASFSAIPFPL